MTKKHTVVLYFLLVIFLFATTSFGQQAVSVQPRDVWRFWVCPNCSNDQGYVLTTDPVWFSVGSGAVYQGTTGWIYQPPAGYIPANSALKPIYAWRVSQGDRGYYYYNETYSQLGSDYTYLGVFGYMYSAYGANEVTVGTQTYPLNKIRYCYSQSRGYWFGRVTVLTSNPFTYSYEDPPDGSYDCAPPHGMVGASVSTIVPPTEIFVRTTGGGGGGGECNIINPASSKNEQQQSLPPC